VIRLNQHHQTTKEKEENPMRLIRNGKGNLVAMLDEQTETIVIKRKDSETRITRNPDGTYEIINIQLAA
jgi:hypothetical protein